MRVLSVHRCPITEAAVRFGTSSRSRQPRHDCEPCIGRQSSIRARLPRRKKPVPRSDPRDGFATGSAAPKEFGLTWESRGSPIYSAGLCSHAASLTPVARRVQMTVASLLPSPVVYVYSVEPCPTCLFGTSPSLALNRSTHRRLRAVVLR
jgi:hypothetical protein